MLVHLPLDEYGAALRAEAGGEEGGEGGFHGGGVVGRGGEAVAGVDVYDAVVEGCGGGGAVLQGHEGLEGAEVVAQVEGAGGLDAGEDGARGLAFGGAGCGG